MSKLRVVVFSDKGARILVNPENAADYKNATNALINPNLEKVRGLPPHLWDLKNGEIVPLAEEKHEARTTLASGINASPKPRYRLWRRLLPLAYALFGAAIALAIRAYL
jgi:uncharacterized membrane protein YcjF (UPF0283 family)